MVTRQCQRNCKPGQLLFCDSLALPFGNASIAGLYAFGSVFPSFGNSSKDTSKPLYASEMFFWRCSPAKDQHSAYGRTVQAQATQHTDCGKFAARCTNHRQLADFPASSEIEQRKAYDANLLV
jgi:hypothetical protein